MRCVIAACDEEAVANDWCRHHYNEINYWHKLDPRTTLKPQMRVRACFVCGAFFTLKSSKKIFCSDACRKKCHRSAQAGNPIHNPHNPIIAKYEAYTAYLAEEEKVLEIEPFTNSELLEDWDGYCAECNRLITKNLHSAWYRPVGHKDWTGTLDNRVPLHSSCKKKWEDRPYHGRERKARVGIHRRNVENRRGEEGS